MEQPTDSPAQSEVKTASKSNAHTYFGSEAYAQVAQIFPVADRQDFVFWFQGHRGRDWRTERALVEAVRKGKLRRARHGKRYVYWSPTRWRGNPPSIRHGLLVTQALLGFYAARQKGAMVVPERDFRGFKVVPDFGLLYEGGTLLLCEVETATDRYRTKGKVTRYNHHLAQIEAHFGARAVVVFVMEQPRALLRRWVARGVPWGAAHYFCDADTFFHLPDGRPLTAPVYLWGGDGQTYPLTGDGP